PAIFSVPVPDTRCLLPPPGGFCAIPGRPAMRRKGSPPDDLGTGLTPAFGLFWEDPSRGRLVEGADRSHSGLALKHDQVERRGIPGQGREQAMGLAAMMGLVIEKMVERRGKRLLDIARIADGPIGEPAREALLRQSIDVARDALVLVRTRPAQGREIIVENC